MARIGDGDFFACRNLISHLDHLFSVSNSSLLSCLILGVLWPCVGGIIFSTIHCLLPARDACEFPCGFCRHLQDSAEHLGKLLVVQSSTRPIH